jgi:protein involved in polysaccharide export with SLBB domain
MYSALTERLPRLRQLASWLPRLAVALLLVGGLSGCAALSNPVADGVPVRRLPPDFLPLPKEEEKTIPLTLLRQKPPEIYRLAAGDVLGVYIEGVLGDKTQPPPVRFTDPGNVPPAFGFPLPVREDGTVPLPLVKPVLVKDLSIPEAQEAIRKAYVEHTQILKADRDRIVVTLMRPRQYHVLVVRQDSGASAIGAGGLITGTKRGTGAAIDLPAYENDVLTALTKTGGLPGLDALNEVMIQRGAIPGGAEATAPHPAAPNIVRIPLRMRPGETLPFHPEDIILQTGDIVFIEARDTEVYYTGGLIFPRQFVLPRDYDLRVVDAVALAGGPLVNGGINQNNLSGNLIASGLGSPSPSLVSVLRRTKFGGQINIRVDLNRALRDQRENILIQPGDVIILQETVGESLTRYLTTVFRFEYLATLIRQRDFVGTSTGTFP